MKHPSRRTFAALAAAAVVMMSACDGSLYGTGGSGTTGIAQGSANLASLTMSAAAIAPSFDPAITSYTATVPNGTSSTTVTASAATNGATLKIAGQTANNGAASQPIVLTVGTTNISIVVTNPDGGTKTYIIAVTRNS